MPERINFKIGAIGGGYDAYGRPRPLWVKPLRLHDVIDTIKNNAEWQDWMKEEMIRKVSNGPVGALKYFYSHMDQYLEEIKRKKFENEKERNEENEEISITSKEDISKKDASSQKDQEPNQRS